MNLKQVIVGDAAAIAVPPPTHQSPSPTNAIVDSGTNGLDIAPAVFDAMLAKLSPEQVKLIRATQVSTKNIDLDQWPTLTFVLQGDSGDMRLDVGPGALLADGCVGSRDRRLQFVARKR